MTIGLQEVRVQDLCLAETRALQHVAITELRKHGIGVSHGILKGENLLILCSNIANVKHLYCVMSRFMFHILFHLLKLF